MAAAVAAVAGGAQVLTCVDKISFGWPTKQAQSLRYKISHRWCYEGTQTAFIRQLSRLSIVRPSFRAHQVDTPTKLKIKPKM